MATRFERAGAGFPGTGPVIPRQIYALGVLLLGLLFVLLTYKGDVPRAVERVFAAPPATEGLLAERRAHLKGVLGGAYLDVPDGASFRESEGYRKLLARLIDHQRPDDVVKDPPLLDYEGALRNPDLQRAETVKVRGLVNWHGAQKLSQRVFELEDVWRVFLTDINGDDGLAVDLTIRPPALEERRTVVEVTGEFYRLLGFESEKGENRIVPYLLARSLTVVPEVRDTTSALRDPAVVILMLGMAAMIVWGVFRVFSQRPAVRWRAPHIR